MAKRDEYPQNKHIIPRMECILRAVTQASHFLRTIESVLPYVQHTQEFKDLIKKNLDETREFIDLAREAMVGDENQAVNDS